MPEYEPIFYPADESNLIATLVTTTGPRKLLFNALRADDFHTETSRKCYEWLHTLWLKNRNIDDEKVQERIYDRVEFASTMQQANGAKWATSLGNVVEAAQRRKICIAAITAYEHAANVEEPYDDCHRGAMDALTGLGDGRGTELPVSVREQSDVFRQVAKQGGRIVPWGLPSMNVIQRKGGQLHFVAARPSVGKTAFAVSCMIPEAEHGYHPGLFCFEDGDVLARYVSQVSGRLAVQQMFNMGDDDGEHFQKSLERTARLGFELDAGKRRSITDIERIATHWVKNLGVKVIYIDYVQNIKHRRHSDARMRIDDTLDAIKDLSQDLDIPIVCLAQINRGGECVKPRMSQLKETGHIEEVAQSVLLLDRPDADHTGRAPKEGYDVITEGKCFGVVAKQRNGPRPRITWWFNATTMQFSDIEQDRRSMDDNDIPKGGE